MTVKSENKYLYTKPDSVSWSGPACVEHLCPLHVFLWVSSSKTLILLHQAAFYIIVVLRCPQVGKKKLIKSIIQIVGCL